MLGLGKRPQRLWDSLTPDAELQAPQEGLAWGGAHDSMCLPWSTYCGPETLLRDS